MIQSGMTRIRSRALRDWIEALKIASLFDNHREKMEGRGGGEAQWVATPPPPQQKLHCFLGFLAETQMSLLSYFCFF
jgi:hypothetical protein